MAITWLVSDNFDWVFRLNPPRVSQKSLGLLGRRVPANPPPLARRGKSQAAEAAADARDTRRMGV